MRDISLYHSAALMPLSKCELLAGRLLRSVALPVPLLAVVLELWEQAVFVGAADGKIFEVPLVVKQHSNGKTLLSGHGHKDLGIHVLAGHTGAVNSLATTSCGYNLVSGSFYVSSASLGRHLTDLIGPPLQIVGELIALQVRGGTSVNIRSPKNETLQY